MSLAKALLLPFVALTWLALTPATTSAQSIQTDHVPGLVEWGVVEFTTPTRVFDKILWGKYIVVHDKLREERGEPCTTFHKIDTSTLGNVGDIQAAFHCVLVEGVDPTEQLAMYAKVGYNQGPWVLWHYQFAGRTESHQMPRSAKYAATGVGVPGN